MQRSTAKVNAVKKTLREIKKADPLDLPWFLYNNCGHNTDNCQTYQSQHRADTGENLVIFFRTAKAGGQIGTGKHAVQEDRQSCQAVHIGNQE